jgi:uncharacterized membrane protein YphA (DoxX/SURF4 family)
MLNKNRTIAFVLMMTTIFAIIPFVAQAHVKWFTDIQAEKVTLDEILSPLFITLTLAIAGLLAILTQLLPMFSRMNVMHRIDLRLDQYRRYSFVILRYGIALSLLLQLISGSMLVPEFQLDSTLGMVVVGAVIALLLVPYPLFTKAAGALLLMLFVYLTYEAGIFHMLDYGFYVAIAGVLLVEKTRFEKWGFPLLYLGTGLSLCWVALEKWVFPSMAIDIIQNHGVPVFGFSPDAFVVMAAFIEFVVGYLLVVGILNRILSVVLTLIFISTTLLFGWTEVVGHSIIHVILITFVLEGVSFYKPPVHIHKTVVDQMVFVSLNFIFVLATFLVIYIRFA